MSIFERMHKRNQGSYGYSDEHPSTYELEIDHSSLSLRTYELFKKETRGNTTGETSSVRIHTCDVEVNKFNKLINE